MTFSQSSSSILYDDVINSQTESLSTSIKSSSESSLSLKFIDFWRYLVQYSEHDDSVRENELQSKFKEWWILTNYEWKNTDDSQFSIDKFNWKHHTMQWDDHLHVSNEWQEYLKTAHQYINVSCLICCHCDENIAHSTLINSDTNSL